MARRLLGLFRQMVGWGLLVAWGRGAFTQPSVPVQLLLVASEAPVPWAPLGLSPGMQVVAPGRERRGSTGGSGTGCFLSPGAVDPQPPRPGSQACGDLSPTLAPAHPPQRWWARLAQPLRRGDLPFLPPSQGQPCPPSLPARSCLLLQGCRLHHLGAGLGTVGAPVAQPQGGGQDTRAGHMSPA